jgi:hypothetical protein
MAERVIVKPHAELVSIRPARKGGKPHYMGAVSLETVKVTADSLEGDKLEEWSETRELDGRVLRHFTRIFPTDSGWVTLSDDGEPQPVTGNTYRAAYVCGPEFYVA